MMSFSVVVKIIAMTTVSPDLIAFVPGIEGIQTDYKSENKQKRVAGGGNMKLQDVETTAFVDLANILVEFNVMNLSLLLSMTFEVL